MEVNLALLCDAANTTADGKLNILGTFDTIHAGSFPVVHPMMHLVLRFSASPAEAGESRDLTIRVLDPDGKNLGDIEGQLVVPSPAQPGRRVGLELRLSLANTVYPAPGDYAFHVLVGQDEKAVVPLSVELRATDEGESDD